MESNTKNTEQIFSFYKLITEYKIEVPIIQRDYAQGRIDKTEVRNNFLSALLLALKPNQPNLKLDFVYGSIINKAFQPLDGQQRLTTLFLLHWYAANKNNKLEQDAKAKLSNFTYETRISSRDFCSALIKNKIVEDNIIDDELISEKIINSSWFFLSWKKDPTIKAMLRTIDDIDIKFGAVENLWEVLTSDSCPIYFYFVLLEDMGLTDDLYIKMNARGKLLSPFENFKAGLQKYIQDNKWENTLEHRDTFAFKIDTDWTDFFWNNFRSEDNSIDDAFMRFISTIMMIRLSLEKTETDRTFLVRRLQDDSNNLRANIISKESYSCIYEYFELYKERLIDWKNYSLKFPMWRNSASNYLSQIVDVKGASYPQKVLFYAQTVYLLGNNTFDVEKYEEWMRVIRNIISRANNEPDGKRAEIVRSPEAFDGAINLVEELSKGCLDIYGHLSSDVKINSTFAKSQIEEERIKAKLITSDVDYKCIIWKLEDTDLLMGRIEFALFCCGYNGSIESINKVELQKVSEVISEFIGRESEIDPNLRRALLTIESNGKYEYYNYWWSFWNVGQSDKRCLIDKYRVLEYCINHQDCRMYFKNLILKLCETPDLQSIIDSFCPPITMPNWQIRLIKESNLLATKFSNFVAIPSDKSYCYLLKSKRPRLLDGNVKIE